MEFFTVKATRYDREREELFLTLTFKKSMKNFFYIYKTLGDKSMSPLMFKLLFGKFRRID